MRTVEQLVTPGLAADLLERNTGNRKLRHSFVAALASVMTAGGWKESHQGIAIAPDGTLLDGQHRLWAVLLSGVTVPMTITYDVPPESFDVMDGGLIRTLADRIRVDASVTAVANSIVKLIARHAGFVQLELTEEMIGVFSDGLDYFGRLSRRGVCSWQKAAFVIKCGIDEANRGEYMEQFKHLSNGDQAMWPQLWAVRRAKEERRLGGEMAIAWRTWAALDGQRRANPKLSNAQLPTLSKEVDDALIKICPQLVGRVKASASDYAKVRNALIRGRDGKQPAVSARRRQEGYGAEDQHA